MRFSAKTNVCREWLHSDTHELFNKRTGAVFARPDWEWAEIDGGRLVWAATGCLLAGRVGPKGLRHERLLQGFGPMRFERLMAPY
jgi:hypothetical protein